jgi:hypothetical protein
MCLDRLYGGKQLLHGKGLVEKPIDVKSLGDQQIQVGAEAAAAGNGDCSQARMFPVHVTNQLKAIAVGHKNVREEEVEILIGEALGRLKAVGGASDVVACGFEV